MKTGISLSVVVWCVTTSAVSAAGTHLDFRGGRQILIPPDRFANLIAETDGWRLYSAPSARDVLRYRMRAGEGQGGSVAALTVTQVAYSDPVNQNGALLVWDETTLNPGGVNIYVDGTLIGSVEGAEEPGTNTAFLVGFPAGRFVIEVESIDDGSTAEATHMFVAEQPFSDATNLVCHPGDVTGSDACSLEATWENPGPEPEVYAVVLNGTPLGTIPGDDHELTVENAPPGPYTLSLVGFSTAGAEGGEYRGRFVETSCVLTCEAIEAPALGEVGAMCLVALVLGLGCVILRKASVSQRAG